jgi:N-carbamoylputrescine amidase
MARAFRIALLQHGCGEDRAENIDVACEMIRQAAGRGAKLIVTQELFASTYFCQTEDAAHFALAEPIPGPTSRRLGELASELGVTISASLFEKRASGVFHNTSVMIGPDGNIADRYRKMHIPDDPRFYEKFYFAPGDLGFRVQRVEQATTGMLVCWDQWFPEAARITALRGAQVLLYPTAIGWWTTPDGGGETQDDRKQQIEAWQIIQRSHAIANGVFVAAVNRIGLEGEIRFWGSSFVADPGGVVIAEAPADEPAILLADLDLGRIDELREGWPFMRDRRVDAYDGLTQRYLDQADSSQKAAE